MWKKKKKKKKKSKYFCVGRERMCRAWRKKNKMKKAFSKLYTENISTDALPVPSCYNYWYTSVCDPVTRQDVHVFCCVVFFNTANKKKKKKKKKFYNMETQLTQSLLSLSIVTLACVCKMCDQLFLVGVTNLKK